MRRVLRFLLSAALLITVVLSGCHARDTRKLVAIIVPSQDNPYFKAEADAAARRATELGYRVRVDAHDDDAYRQEQQRQEATDDRRRRKPEGVWKVGECLMKP